MSWLGFNTAVSGIITNQRKLHVSNHNIASAEREGYSRQVTKESAKNSFRIPGVGHVGGGNVVNDISRVRNSYTDYKYRVESSPLGDWKTKQRELGQLEDILKGTREHGMNVALDRVFSSLEDLSTNASDDAYRISFRQGLEGMTDVINETAQSLKRQQAGVNKEVGATISEVNTLSKQIARLNEQVFTAEVDGKTANGLRDERDLAVDKLSELANIEVSESAGKLTIKIGGNTLVDHSHVRGLKSPADTMESTFDSTQQLYKVQWEDGEDLELKSGKLKGLLDLRDENGKNDSDQIDGSFKGVPYYVERLNEFARTFAKSMNEIHQKGENREGATDIKLFTIDGESSADFTDYDKMTAFNMGISKDISESLNKIMTSETGLPEDNSILRELIEERKNASFFDGDAGATYSGRPEDFITSIISTLGTDAQYATRMHENQEAVMDNIIDHRMSESGVDLNEEMNNVVKFQQLYGASARMISTFDQIMDITINRLGIVGR